MTFFHGLFRNLLFTFLPITRRKERKELRGTPKVWAGAARTAVLLRGAGRAAGASRTVALAGEAEMPFNLIWRRQADMQIRSLGWKT